MNYWRGPKAGARVKVYPRAAHFLLPGRVRRQTEEHESFREPRTRWWERSQVWFLGHWIPFLCLVFDWRVWAVQVRFWAPEFRPVVAPVQVNIDSKQQTGLYTLCIHLFTVVDTFVSVCPQNTEQQEHSQVISWIISLWQIHSGSYRTGSVSQTAARPLSPFMTFHDVRVSRDRVWLHVLYFQCSDSLLFY